MATGGLAIFLSGSQVSVPASRGAEHTPEICLPAIGRKLLRDNGYQRFFFGDHVLSVRHEVFDDFGQPLNVFFIM